MGRKHYYARMQVINPQDADININMFLYTESIVLDELLWFEGKNRTPSNTLYR
jgi:hypothetical protein